MKIKILVALMLGFAGVAGACPKGKPELVNGEWLIPRCAEKQESESSKPITIKYEGTKGESLIYKPSKTVVISTDGDVTPLSEFIISGKFCTWRGKHEWEPSIKSDYYHYACGEYPKSDGFSISVSNIQGDWCKFCHRCRRKIKVSKEVEEWEP